MTIAKENVGTSGTADRTANVLPDKHLPQRAFWSCGIGIWDGRSDVEGSAERMDALIDGNARVRSKRDPLGAGAAEPRVAKRQILEEDKRSVFFHHRPRLFWMLIHPRTDRLHRDFLARDLAFLNEGAADRCVRPAVLRAIGDAVNP